MHLSRSEQLPLLFFSFFLAFFVCKSLQSLISALTQRVKVVIYLGSLVQWCCGEGGALQAHISGVCGERSQCLGHTGSVPAHGVSQSTLLRLRVALQGNCPKRTLGCMNFPGLSQSGSGSGVLHKGADFVGPAFCALPRSEELRRPGAWQTQSPQVGGASYRLPGPDHSVPGVCPVSPLGA